MQLTSAVCSSITVSHAARSTTPRTSTEAYEPCAPSAPHGESSPLRPDARWRCKQSSRSGEAFPPRRESQDYALRPASGKNHAAFLNAKLGGNRSAAFAHGSIHIDGRLIRCRGVKIVFAHAAIHRVDHAVKRTRRRAVIQINHVFSPRKESSDRSRAPEIRFNPDKPLPEDSGGSYPPFPRSVQSRSCVSCFP